MPFDGKTFREPLKTGLAGLAQLRDELRKPMPEGHEWDFGWPYLEKQCGTMGCALGLAVVLWPAAFPSGHPRGGLLPWASNHFQIDGDCVSTLFNNHGYPGKLSEEVTPAMVADKIDEHLKANGFSG